MPEIVSVCRWLPSPTNEAAGVFVYRRLEALSQQLNLSVIQPIPYFPLIKGVPEWAKRPQRMLGTLSVSHEKMFYVPKILKRLDGYWLFKSILDRIREWHSSGGVRLIDAHFGYPDGVGSVRAGKTLNIPVFVTFRGLENDYIDDQTIGGQIATSLQDATGCICVSHSLKELAIRYGADEDKIRVIHNSIDRKQFYPGSRADSRQHLSLPPNDPLIVSVGHLASVKRHHVLIKAFAGVLAMQPNARLTIVGGAGHEPKYEIELRELTRRLGVSGAVSFAGRIPPADVANWLRAADVFSLASQREGCSNAILEALAVGIPVVTTPVGDNKYFVRDGDNGFIVPVDDPNAMQTALCHALSASHWDRDRISSGLSVGSWSQVASQIVEFYNERTC